MAGNASLPDEVPEDPGEGHKDGRRTRSRLPFSPPTRRIARPKGEPSSTENRPRPQQAGAYRSEEERLIYVMEQCLRKGWPTVVNLSVPRHAAITRSLRKFVYDAEFKGCELPVVFKDGSRPPAFPVGCLSEPEPFETSQDRVIYAGLMSMRHPELDYLVDFYVTRNQELVREASMADEEQLAFERTVALLDVRELDDGAEVRVLHTGLEPMVVGFYRGVVDILARRKTRNLVIRSMLYHGKKSAGPFHPGSPGADLSKYDRSLLWW